jgi:hypothetical protein
MCTCVHVYVCTYVHVYGCVRVRVCMCVGICSVRDCVRVRLERESVCVCVRVCVGGCWQRELCVCVCVGVYNVYACSPQRRRPADTIQQRGG